MKLTTKITLGLFPVVLLVLAVNTTIRVNREIALFQNDMRRDQHVLGTVLRAAVAEVWRVEGEERALRLLDFANEAEQKLQIRWVWLDAPPGDPQAPEIEPASLGGLRDDDDVFLVRHDLAESDEDDRLYTYVRTPTPAGRAGAIEISESLLEEGRYIRKGVRNSVLAILALAGLGYLLHLAFGALFVGRPVGRLVGHARRIASGELGRRLDLGQKDELGVLAREMDAMSDRLAEANERLAAEAEARIRALEQLRHADRLKSVGNLASGIAHELGTPLHVVGGRAKMIASGEVEGEEARKNARIVAEQAERMAAIIRQLLDFARPGRARIEPTDLAPVIRSTLALLEPTARKRGVRFEELDLGSAIAPVDHVHVQQALLNLLVNAVQASPERGGTVRVGIRRVEAPGGGQAPFLAVDVIDDGAGVAPEHLPHLFEPFFTTKGPGEGTGLGLAVTWGIAREHGGTVEVESAPGAGSRFTLLLPASPEARNLQANAPAAKEETT